MKLRSWHLHTIPAGLALAAGLALFIRVPTTVRTRPKTAENRKDPVAAIPAMTTEQMAEHVRIPPRPAPPQPSQAAPVVESEWIHTMVSDQNWSTENLARLHEIFVRPSDPHAWEAALWAVRRLEHGEVSGWVDEFLRSGAPLRDRKDALGMLAWRTEPLALVILLQETQSPEVEIRAAAVSALHLRMGWDRNAVACSPWKGDNP